MHFSPLFLSTLLAGLNIPPAQCLPDCVRPPPPLIPTVEDCDATLSKIMTIARSHGNLPKTWSRHPRRLSGQLLPARFSADLDNDCEIFVDVDDPTEQDTFPMSSVAAVGQEIMHACLLGSSMVEDTVGVESVGQKGVVEVWLQFKGTAVQRNGNVTYAFARSTGVVRSTSQYTADRMV